MATAISNSLIERRGLALISGQQEVEKKSGYLWKMIGLLPGEEGFRYLFCIQQGYNNLTPSLIKNAHLQIEANQKIAGAFQKMFPALEYSANSPYCSNLELLPLMKGLGYGAQLTRREGMLLQVPDVPFFMSQVRRLAQTNPEWNHVHLVSFAGVLSHKEYVGAFLLNQTPVSDVMEFLHDHFYHVYALIMLIDQSGKNGNPTYGEEKERLNAMIEQDREEILKIAPRVALTLSSEEMQKEVGSYNLETLLLLAEAMISIITDGTAALESYAQTKMVLSQTTKQRILAILLDSRWLNYLGDQFCHESIGEPKKIETMRKVIHLFTE